MTDYVSFLLASNASEIEYETIELSHPSLSVVYRLVRNKYPGLTATLETSEEVYFQSASLKINKPDGKTNLDQSITVTLGDDSDIIPSELDAINSGESWATPPKLTLRTYRQNDLSGPMYGPVVFDVAEIDCGKGGLIRLVCKAPGVNKGACGMFASLSLIPQLRALV